MNIDRLRYFSAVVEAKSIRKAAEIVGIAPASMSKAISVLEAEVGEKLLFAEGRGIGITPKGEAMYQAMIPLLLEHSRFCKNLQTGPIPHPEIRLGTFEVFSTYFLSELILKEPNFKFQVLERVPHQIEASLLKREIDFGLTYLPIPQDSLEWIEIGEFKMGIFGLSKWSSLPFEALPFAVPVADLKVNPLNEVSLDLWPRNGPKREIKYQFQLLETCLQVAAGGSAVLHCPDFVIRLFNKKAKMKGGLGRLAFPRGYGPEKKFKAYLVFRKGESPGRIEGKLAKLMRSV